MVAMTTNETLIHDGETTWTLEHEGQEIDFAIDFRYFHSFGTMYCTEASATPVGLDEETMKEAIRNEMGPNIYFDNTIFNY